MLSRFLVVILSATIMAPARAHAGIIRGTLRAPAVEWGAPSASRPGAGPSLRRGTSDAVVYLEKARGGVERRMAKLADEPRIVEVRHKFVPRVLPVVQGTTVRFENQDRIFHSAFSRSPPQPFDLGICRPGEVREVKFDAVGVVRVYCDVEPTMVGYILVLPHRAFVRPDSAGAFVFPAVPRGTYTLKVWHPSLGELSREVEIPRSGEAIVSLSY